MPNINTLMRARAKFYGNANLTKKNLPYIKRAKTLLNKYSNSKPLTNEDLKNAKKLVNFFEKSSHLIGGTRRKLRKTRKARRYLH